jgi:hypothetical protein
MNTIISLFGILLSAVGMGTSTASQVQSWHNQANPQAQVQTYSQCPSGYGQVRQAPDGHYYIECLEVRQ